MTLRNSKFRVIWTIVLAWSGTSLLTADINKGDSFQDVTSALGEPRGIIESGTHKTVFFDRGEVVLLNDQVQSFNLVSQEVFEQQKVLQEKRREEALARRELERMALIERGEEVKADKLSDPRFLSQPVTRRLAFWNQFRSVYPEVDVSAEVAETAAEYQAYLEEVERERRIMELESRVLAAEDRAARAEQEARRNRSRGAYYGRVYPAVPYRPQGNRVILHQGGSTVSIGGYNRSGNVHIFRRPENNKENVRPPFQSNREQHGSIIPPVRGTSDMRSGVPDVRGNVGEF